MLEVIDRRLSTREIQERQEAYQKAAQPILHELYKLAATQTPKMILHPDGRMEYKWPPEYEAARTSAEELLKALRRDIICR